MGRLSERPRGSQAASLDTFPTSPTWPEEKGLLGQFFLMSNLNSAAFDSLRDSFWNLYLLSLVRGANPSQVGYCHKVLQGKATVFLFPGAWVEVTVLGRGWERRGGA